MNYLTHNYCKWVSHISKHLLKNLFRKYKIGRWLNCVQENSIWLTVVIRCEIYFKLKQLSDFFLTMVIYSNLKSNIIIGYNQIFYGSCHEQISTRLITCLLERTFNLEITLFWKYGHVIMTLILSVFITLTMTVILVIWTLCVKIIIRLCTSY
jgi:hypothetical protein